MQTSNAEFERLKAIERAKKGRIVTHIEILYPDGTRSEFNTEDYRIVDYILKYRILDTERFVHIPLGNIQQFTTESRRIFE